MKTFIESIEFPSTTVLLKRVKKNDIFGETEDADLTETSLVKCELLKVGKNTDGFYKEGDMILVKANNLRKIQYDECPPEILTVFNEDLIFGKLNE